MMARALIPFYEEKNTLKNEGENRVQSADLYSLNDGSLSFVITISSVLCTLNSVLSLSQI